jgi:hypothetical protein
MVYTGAAPRDGFLRERLNEERLLAVLFCNFAAGRYKRSFENKI